MINRALIKWSKNTCRHNFQSINVGEKQKTTTTKHRGEVTTLHSKYVITAYWEQGMTRPVEQMLGGMYLASQQVGIYWKHADISSAKSVSTRNTLTPVLPSRYLPETHWHQHCQVSIYWKHTSTSKSIHTLRNVWTSERAADLVVVSGQNTQRKLCKTLFQENCVLHCSKKVM